MKKLLLPVIILFMLFTNAAFAQQETYALHCTMTVDEILMDNQPFGIDDPIAEKAKHTVIALLDELKQVYAIMNSDSHDGLNEHIDAVYAALEKVIELEMNYAMFEDDLSVVEQIEQEQ